MTGGILAVAVLGSILVEGLSVHATDPHLRNLASSVLPWAFPLSAVIGWISVASLISRRVAGKALHAQMVRRAGLAMTLTAIALSPRPSGFSAMFSSWSAMAVAAERAGASIALIAANSALVKDVARFFLVWVGIAAIYCGNLWWSIAFMGLLMTWAVAPGLFWWVAGGMLLCTVLSSGSCPRCGHPAGLRVTASSFAGTFTRWTRVRRSVPFTATSNGSYGAAEYSGTADFSVDEPSVHSVYDEVLRCRRCGHREERRVIV